MILLLTCTYMAFNYAVFYMFVLSRSVELQQRLILYRLLVIFTRIFRGVYNISAGLTGVLFLMSRSPLERFSSMVS